MLDKSQNIPSVDFEICFALVTSRLGGHESRRTQGGRMTRRYPHQTKGTQKGKKQGPFDSK